ncbi:MAG: hypothetical protein JO091_12965, partial [Acidobacteriaceae bacterium]|nr:hypothetical protein [Acidobacteriaceae bacterium]
MNRHLRHISIAAASALALFCALLATALYTIETNWFKNKVREHVVTAIEQSTGGRVDIGEFTYSWRTLTADFRNLDVHGTEAPRSQPLFHADSVRVQLHLVSIFERNIDVGSLIVTHPKVHILLAGDGATNIPPPKLGRRSAGETIEALLNLKVQRFEFRDGVFEIDTRRLPLRARGENLFLMLTYDRRGPRYHATIASRQVRIDAEHWPSVALQLESDADLEKDRVVFHRLFARSNGSKLEAKGTIQHFAHPVMDFALAAQLSAFELG